MIPMELLWTSLYNKIPERISEEKLIQQEFMLRTTKYHRQKTQDPNQIKHNEIKDYVTPKIMIKSLFYNQNNTQTV